MNVVTVKGVPPDELEDITRVRDCHTEYFRRIRKEVYKEKCGFTACPDLTKLAVPDPDGNAGWAMPIVAISPTPMATLIQMMNKVYGCVANGRQGVWMSPDKYVDDRNRPLTPDDIWVNRRNPLMGAYVIRVNDTVDPDDHSAHWEKGSGVTVYEFAILDLAHFCQTDQHLGWTRCGGSTTLDGGTPIVRWSDKDGQLKIYVDGCSSYEPGYRERKVKVIEPYPQPWH